MTCIHIYAPPSTRVNIRLRYCPICEHDMPMLQICYEWFGPDEICLNCGDSWGDKELSARPFARGWRQQSVEDAIKLARNLGLEIYAFTK